MIQYVNKSKFGLKRKNLNFGMIFIYLNMIFSELGGKKTNNFFDKFC